MTPRPEPSPRSDNNKRFVSSEEVELFLGDDRDVPPPRRMTTMSSDDDDDDDCASEDRPFIDRDPSLQSPMNAFSTVYHRHHHHHHHHHPNAQQQQQHHHEDGNKEQRRGRHEQDQQHHPKKMTSLPPSFSLSIPVSRSSSSSTSLDESVPPRVASSWADDLEEGIAKKNQQVLASLPSSPSKSRPRSSYLRRRRKLRSFASFAPSLLLRRSSSSFGRRSAAREPWSILPPTIAIPLLNGIDMFAVSLVIPLLFQYYRAAGVTSAGHRELLSSVFSASQIVGGLMLGVLTDANLVERKTILLLSFGGSAVSYAFIASGGLHTLLLSRVLVGLVKHTMTVCTTILTHHTTKENRARGLGRLTASSTVAWVVGPTVGALLYRYVDPRAPVLLACLLFTIDFVLAWVLVDHDPKPTDPNHTNGGGDASQSKDVSAGKPKQLSKLGLIVRNLKCCFGSRALGSAVATKLLLTWINRATSYANLGTFYEDMYNLQPHHRGYISSYQQLVQLAANVRLISPALEWAGGERRATIFCVAITAAAVWLESLRSLPLFLIVLCPVIALAYSISELSVQTLVTHVAPPSGMFSVLAAMDVLQSAVTVSVPFYRTWLFGHLPRDASEGAMEGDPDPVAWVVASSLHWLLAAAVLTFALTRESWWVEDHPHHVHKAVKGK